MFSHTLSTSGNQPRPRAAARIAASVLAYSVLGLALTWPLAAHFLTHVPGDGIDDPSLAWNLWWVKHALVDRPQNPFDCNWQFWPIGINLAFYTLTVLNGMLGIPLQAVFGLIPTYNLLLLSSFVLSGLGGYLLAREFLGEPDGKRLREYERGGTGVRLSVLADVAAFVGGALYAFASAKMFYAGLGQGNIASSQWAPFAALYIWRAARRSGTARDAALAALFLVLQAYAELTYASFLLIFAALAFLWGLRGRILPLLGRFVVIAALFAVGIAPVLAAMLPDLAAEGDFFTSGGGFADIFSADLAGYAIPTQLHPVLGDIVRGWSEQVSQGNAGRQFAIDKGQHIYVGYVALGLAIAGAWRNRRSRTTWLWVGGAVMFFLLTLGPNLRVAGLDTGIPLPFRIIEQLPFFKGNRYPSRYAVMLLLCLAPLVASGALAVLRSGLPARAGGTAAHPQGALRVPASLPLLATAMLGFMLFEHLSAPLPVSDLRVPALYEEVAQEEGDFALLELPLGWRNGARVAGKQDVLIMQQLWYQTTHGKRVLGGNTSRNPAFKFQYFSEQPTLARLIAMTNAADVPQHDALRAALAAQPVTASDREQAAAWAAFTNIRYVMVHRNKLTAQTEAVARDLLSLSLVAEEGDLALYQVAQQAAPTLYRLDTDDGRLALGEGWSPVGDDEGRRKKEEGRATSAGEAGEGVIAQRREVRLLLPLDAGAAELRFRAAALVPEQRLSVVVDGESLGEQPLSMADGWVSFDVSADARRSQRGALSDVRLRFSRVVGADTLATQLGSNGPVGLLVRSAGQEAGDFGHIYLNGREVSPNARGYNLVSLDPAGNLLAAASFDTHADPVASAHLAKWVAAQPPGTVVAGAVRDEASMNLEAPALDALRSLGVTTDLRGHFRWGHAFIAVISLPGENAHASWSSPQEGTDAVRPVQASLGLPLSEPQVAAKFYEVQITYK